MEQNSSDWLEWRKRGLGASDIPILLGISPWKTPYQLWEEKLGLAEDDPEKYNFITEKGHRLEPKARALYEIQFDGVDCPPKLAERKDKPHHRASLDGYNEEKNYCVEIKFVGAGDKWKMAQEGKIPDYYMAQMMWQLYVTGGKWNDYVAYNDKEDAIKVIRMEPDIKAIAGIVKKADEFWKLVETKKEPPLTDKDFKKVRDKGLSTLVAELAVVRQGIDPLLKREEELKKAIKEHEGWNHTRMICDGVKLITKTRRGSVDYKKVISENLPELDLTGYVKPSTTYKEIKL